MPISTPLLDYKLSLSMNPSNEAKRIEMSQIEHYLEQLVDSWLILVESIEMLQRGTLNTLKEPEVSHCILKDQNFVGDLNNIKSTIDYGFALAIGLVMQLSKL
ncbi:hypothetical protein CR513_59319, partial [Mucuna pruriens]